MKNPLLVCLVSVLLLSAWGCAHEQLEPRSAQELFQEAVELAEKNKVEEAAEKYLEVRTCYRTRARQEGAPGHRGPLL